MVKDTQTARAARSKKAALRAASVIKAWESEYPNVSVKGLSQRFGVSERQIYRYLKTAGIVLPPQKRKQMDINKVRRAKQLYSELGNKSEVARRMECSVTQVSRCLKVSTPSD